MQRSASIDAVFSTPIAPAGQLASHNPHPRHLSRSTLACKKEGLGPCSICLMRLSSQERRAARALVLTFRACNSSFGFISLSFFASPGLSSQHGLTTSGFPSFLSSPLNRGLGQVDLQCSSSRCPISPCSGQWLNVFDKRRSLQ